MSSMDEIYNLIQSNKIVWGCVKGALVIVLTLLALGIGRKMINSYFKLALMRKNNINKIKTIKKVTNNIYKVIILFISTTMFLSNVIGVDTSSIITVAGVSGIAVGFASQNIVKDLIMGIMLLMEDNITIGDIIKTNGYKGVIEDLNLRSISIRDEYDVLHVIPNNIIKDFSNFSRKKS